MSDVKDILLKVQSGEMSPEQALSKIKTEPFEDLGYALVDHHRKLRQGACEVIYGRSKTKEQILGILSAMKDKGEENVLVTGIDEEKYNAITREHPVNYEASCGLAVVFPKEIKRVGNVIVLTAGTSDIKIAEEAAITAETLGSKVTRIYDAGVAGLHRLLSHLDELTEARVIVAVAGMEGALPSVVGGLVSCPVIAVPTSVGYGASFGGVSALLSMLNSCASGMAVVNIDNGFGAGFLAHRINTMESPKD